MERRVDDERFRELCAEHLLSGLEGPDRDLFRRELLRRGSDGQAELDRLREVLGSLAASVAPVPPPEGLKGRVMARLDREDLGDDGETRTGGGRGGGSPARDAEIGPRGSAGLPPWAWAAASVAAAAVAAFFLVRNAELRDSLAETRTALERTRAEAATADSLKRELERMRGDLATVASPRSLALSLDATREDMAGRARVFVDPQSGKALLFAYDMEILPPDSVYQLWSIRGDTPRSAGTFQVGRDGRARVEVEPGSLVTEADAIAVTVEPAPGRDAPSTQPILVGSS